LRVGELVLPGEILAEGEMKSKNLLIENVRLFFQRHRLPKEVALAFYHPRMVIHHVHLPDMPEGELENALRWEASSIITGEDNLQVGWYPLRKDEHGLEILFSATPTVAVQEWVEAFFQAGIRIEAIEPQALSLARALLSFYQELQRIPFILIDIGFQKSAIVYFNEGHLKFARYFSWGLHKIWNLLEEKFSLSTIDIMEMMKRGNEGNNLPYQLEEGVREGGQDLAVELRRSLAFLQTEFKADVEGERCFVIGGGACLVPLRRLVAQNISPHCEGSKPFVLGRESIPSERFLSALGASLWS